MKLHGLLEQSYQNFHRYLNNTRAVLLHPNNRYRSVLLARLMNASDMRVFYYALGHDDTTLQSFITGMTHDLANQHVTFGRHLNLLPPRVHENYNAHVELVLEAFVAELSELSDQLYIIILDEYDRCDDDDEVQRFTEKLIDRMPDHCRIVLNSRTLPRLPWVSLIAKRQAILLSDDDIVTDDFYSIKIQPENQLEVFGLGPGYVMVNGEPIDNWEGHLPRLLLFLALDRPIVTRSEICQAFWPELDEDQAVNVFHVTKRRLHKALDMDVLVHDGKYYSINPKLKIYYDVIEFVQTLIQSRGEASENVFELWDRASHIYRGPFLQGHTDDWIVMRRKAFAYGYIEILNNMAQVYLDNGKIPLALNFYLRAAEADDTRQDMHRQIMSLYARLDRSTEAIAHYQAMEKRLKQLKLKPDLDTQALAQSIMESR